MSSFADERSALLLKRKDLKLSLRELRKVVAAKLKVSFMQVFQDSTLADIVVLMPKTQAELVKIKGIGPKKYEQFGIDILALLAAYRPEHRKDMCQSAQRR
ncbi:hypothetical protein MPSEU_000165000 [Mayamaea pseudoterrestris]|nr:hypothetical protein MPSEU_000165000 [Mayamaea pseudoterrestris]